MRKAISFLAAAASTLVLAAGGRASETITYKYDTLGRLVEAKSTGTVNNNVTTGTSYDPAGNRTNYSVTGSSGSASLDDPASGAAWAWRAPPPRHGGESPTRPDRPAFLRSYFGGTPWLPMPLEPPGDPAAPEASPF